MQLSKEEVTFLLFIMSALGGIVTKVVPEIWKFMIGLINKKENKGHDYLSKNYHAEICRLKMSNLTTMHDHIGKRLEDGNEQFKELLEKYHNLDKRISILEERKNVSTKYLHSGAKS